MFEAVRYTSRRQVLECDAVYFDALVTPPSGKLLIPGSSSS
jgi:hypothetical protein